VIGLLTVWAAVEAFQISSVQATSAGHGYTSVSADLIAVKMVAATAAWMLIRWVQRTPQSDTLYMATGLLLIIIAWRLPGALRIGNAPGSTPAKQDFSAWIEAIPATSTVFVTPNRDVGSFVWFTLLRPNYLTLNQSAGVVFSRDTALEVERRSEVLLPLEDPDWKILSGGRKSPSRKLTLEILQRICTDPQLGFVISPEALGIPSIKHRQSGPWMDWNLYDCAQVRQPSLKS
jgi:hypothetical protein